MERNLHYTSNVPRDLPFQLLEDITDRFSEDHRVGSGGFGDVYRGVLHDGEVIAVKKLNPTLTLDDKEFMQEFNNLMRVQHPNIVRLVGYCYETKRTHIEIEGQYRLATIEGRALCFEYFPKGSLDKYLSDESCGLDWCTRYKIIKGICDGLNYLHCGLKKPVFHLDLKPANILLDMNMVPKIADFGLSRFLLESNSHITTAAFRGTIAYMPPEYITKRQISNKYDVFSLGVIITQLIAGPEGYLNKEYVDISPQEFIELMHNKWRNRMQETSINAEKYCEQVKTSIEIALTCLEVDKNKRPTIGNIIDKFMQIETVNYELSMPFSTSVDILEEGSDENKSVLAKFGPWGGNVGKAHNIKVAPHRLESVTIWSAVIVDAFSFSYIQANGKKHTIGTWGGPGGFINRIQFGPSEFLLEISGTTGPYVYPVTDVVTSLKLATNVRSYGPFGSGGGTPFHTSVQDNGSIVGFFGCAGVSLHAIGVYVNPNRNTLADLETLEEAEAEQKDAVTKIGPWGGNGGMPHDMEVVPHRLESLTICSDVVVHSLAFSYCDVKGGQHTVGRWGGPGGNSNTIRLGRFGQIKGISGTYAPFDSSPNVITSLTVDTNIDSKRYGQGGGTPFSVPLDKNGSVVGFFGRAMSYLDALGVYARTY